MSCSPSSTSSDAERRQVTQEPPRLDDVLAARPKTVDLPAPTAAPHRRWASASTLLSAGLVTHVVDQRDGRAAARGRLRRPGSARCCPHEHHETVPVEPQPPSSRRTIAQNVARLDAGRDRAPRAPAHRDPPGVGRHQGRPRRQRRHGRARDPLRAHRRAASGIRSTCSPPAPPRAWRACPPEALRPFSLQGLLLGHGDPPLHLGHGRAALRRDAPDVPAAADPARRRDRAAPVDGPALRRCSGS